MVDLYDITSGHERRIAINEDQWPTIALLCDPKDDIVRQNCKFEEELIANKKIIAENKYKITELKDCIATQHEKNDLRNVEKNIMYLLLVGFLIIIIIFK